MIFYFYILYVYFVSCKDYKFEDEDFLKSDAYNTYLKSDLGEAGYSSYDAHVLFEKNVLQ